MTRPEYLDIAGNAEARQWLSRSRSGPYPSLLFTGPQGLGKRLCALWYAALLNCHQAGAEPCGQCPSCLKIASGNHADLLVSERVDNKKTLGVGEIREGISRAQYAPFERGFRVWIVPEAERLTEEAQNALLKTLEEPPRSLITVLVTSNPGILLPTVTSRCQPLRFRPLANEEVEQLLVQRGCGREQAQQVAGLAEGRVGAALRYVQSPLLWEQREATLDLLLKLPGGDLWTALETSQELEGLRVDREDRGALERLLETTRSLYRDVMIRAAGGPVVALANGHRQAEISELTEKLGQGRAVLALQRIAEAEEQMSFNVSPRLWLQRLCMRLAKGN